AAGGGAGWSRPVLEWVTLTSRGLSRTCPLHPPDQTAATGGRPKKTRLRASLATPSTILFVEFAIAAPPAGAGHYEKARGTWPWPGVDGPARHGTSVASCPTRPCVCRCGGALNATEHQPVVGGRSRDRTRPAENPRRAPRAGRRGS